MFNSDTLKRAAWTALQAFIGVYLTLAVGLSQYHNYDEIKSAALALIPAAIAAAASVLKNALVTGDAR